jgi:hypothetical protein
MSDMLKVALNCAQKGWFVFPLLEGKKTPDLSLAPPWSENSSNDSKQIEYWWAKNPKANVGVDLGKSNLTVLDFDSGYAPPNIGLSETFGVKTSRGQHLYFSGISAQGKMSFAGKLVGDVKSAGGYVVGPKSLHPSGAVYKLLNTLPVAELPTGILEKLTAQIRKPVDASPNGPMIPYGSHDTELHRISGKLREIGLEHDAILAALMEVAEKRLEAPGSDWVAMVEKHATNICKKPAGPGVTSYVGSSVQQQQQETQAEENWRDYFRSIGQLEDGDVRMILNGFLPEGINAIGALSSHGKTLFALSIAKAITTGEPFLGKFQLDDVIPCLFLTPESSSRAFKMRCKAFGIPNDPELFLCRTVSEGATLLLDDPILRKAVESLKPVIFLDTMVRFNQSKDENDAAANQKLAKDIIELRAAGAVSVVILHHSTKASANEEMTLENCLRGTGDIAALCDSVYAIRRDRTLYADGGGPNEIEVKCVKPRDFVPPVPFRIAATYKTDADALVSYIDETGDFQIVEQAAVQQALESKFVKLVTEDPALPEKDVQEVLGIKQHILRNLKKKLGWNRSMGRYGVWSFGPITRPESPAAAMKKRKEEAVTENEAPAKTENTLFSKQDQSCQAE